MKNPVEQGRNGNRVFCRHAGLDRSSCRDCIEMYESRNEGLRERIEAIRQLAGDADESIQVVDEGINYMTAEEAQDVVRSLLYHIRYIYSSATLVQLPKETHDVSTDVPGDGCLHDVPREGPE